MKIRESNQSYYDNDNVYYNNEQQHGRCIDITVT
jgi:hypothetical protein